MECPHENFVVEANVNRLTSVPGGPAHSFVADIRVRCADCEEPFQWMGLPFGIDTTRPTASVGRLELRAPLRPMHWGWTDWADPPIRQESQ